MDSVEFTFEFFLHNQNRIIETYEAGDFLYLNGTPAIGVFFICSGKVQVISQTDEGFLVREIKTAGEVIGLDEIELHYYATDAIALEETEVYFFDRYLFLEIK